MYKGYPSLSESQKVSRKFTVGKSAPKKLHLVNQGIVYDDNHSKTYEVVYTPVKDSTPTR
jgi:hypothetical protein